MKLNNVVRKSTFLLIVMLLPGAAVSALANEFDKLVKQIESQFRVKQRKIPFMGLAGFAVKIARPAGVKEFKLAVFDSHDFTEKPGDPNFKLFMRATLVPEKWGPLFQIQNHDGTRSYIYSRPKGNDFQLLVVNFSQRDATVVQTKVDPQTLAKWIDKGSGGSGILDAFNLNNATSNSAISIYRKKDIDDEPEDKGNSSTSSDSGTPDTVTNAPAKTKPVLKSVKDSTTSETADDTGDKSAEKAAEKKDSADDPLADKDAIKLSARLVNLNVKVLDQNGRVLSGLQKEDFKVFEENLSQEILHFEPNTAPVKLVLLLDFSGSTEKKVKLMRKTAKKFVDSLNPADQIALASFTRNFSIGSDFTTDHNLLKDRIDHMKIRGSGTAYYDAMWKTLNMFRKSGDSRQAIVVLTDGVDNAIGNPKQLAARHPFADLLERIGEEDATIYPIYLDTEPEMVGHKGGDTHEDYTVARQQLQEVAEQSGGVMFKAARIEDLNGVYQKVAAELHTVYTLAYAPNTSIDKGQWHRITVKLDRPGTVARTRKGYFSK